MPGDTLRKRVRRAEADGSLSTPYVPRADGEPSAAVIGTAAAPVIEQTTDADGGVTLRVRDLPRVRTVDDVIAASGLDIAHWTIKSATIKSYEGFLKSPTGDPVVVPLTSAHVTLAPNRTATAAIAAVGTLLDDVRAHAPKYAPIRYSQPRPDERHMLEVCLFDVHIGMLAWSEEAGTDYDVTIAADIVADAVDRLASRAAGWPIDRILVPLGNDWMHTDATIDGKGGATTRGTPQDVDTRWQKQFRTARRAAVGAIDTLRQVAPVDVVIVPGNHDSERMFTLGEVLDAWYRADDAVTIRNDPSPRKYYRYGTTLLGLAHGHNEKHGDLPLIMATEAGGDWAETTHREWHVGHRHRKGESIPVSEHSAVRVRTMPSLAPADAWHAAKGYHHIRAAEAYIWAHAHGYVGHLSVNAKESAA